MSAARTLKQIYVSIYGMRCLPNYNILYWPSTPAKKVNTSTKVLYVIANYGPADIIADTYSTDELKILLFLLRGTYIHPPKSGPFVN